MPIKLSKSLIAWLERKSPQAKMGQLVSTIGEVNALIKGREDKLSALVRKHIAMAEEDCNAALKNFQFNDKSNNEECMRRLQFGLFRLELAKQQLTIDQEHVCPVNFHPDTAEHGVLALSSAIIQMKMALEFSNCVIEETNTLRLFAVVKMFNEAVDLLRSNEQDQLSRKVEAALLMLYLVKLEIELENRETSIDLHHAWKINSKEAKPLIESFEVIYKLKETGLNSSNTLPQSVTSQLEQAIKNFVGAIEAFTCGQDELAEKLAVTSKIKAQMAEKSIESCPSEDRSETTQAKGERELEKRTNLFKSKVILLQRLVNQRAPQAELARLRLDAALQYYLGAVHIYRKAITRIQDKAGHTAQTGMNTNSQQKSQQLAQANSLVRSALRDLESARNTLFVNK